MPIRFRSSVHMSGPKGFEFAHANDMHNSLLPPSS